MRPTSMGGRRLWCSCSSNYMLTFTGYRRKAWPVPWWACRSFHSGDALKHPGISAGEGLKLFCPWVLQAGWKHGDDCHPPLWEALPNGNCVWYLSGVCQHDSTKHSRPLVSVQKESQQGVCRVPCPWSTQKGSKVPRLKKGIEVSQVKENIQVTGTEGSIWVTWVRWAWIDNRCVPRNAEWNATLCLSEFLLILSLNDSTFFSQMVPNCVFEWTIAQPDKLVRASHSCCNVLVFISYYLGILFHILYQSSNILTYAYLYF